MKLTFFVRLDTVEINFSCMPHTSRGKAKRSYSTCEPRTWLAFQQPPQLLTIILLLRRGTGAAQGPVALDLLLQARSSLQSSNILLEQSLI